MKSRYKGSQNNLIYNNELFLEIRSSHIFLKLLVTYPDNHSFIYQFFDNSLIWAILFYALQYGAYALVVPWSARLLGRLGLKKNDGYG